jgi:hypothetical protein
MVVIACVAAAIVILVLGLLFIGRTEQPLRTDAEICPQPKIPWKTRCTGQQESISLPGAGVVLPELPSQDRETLPPVSC